MESGFTELPQRRLPEPPREELAAVNSALSQAKPFALYGVHGAGKRALLQVALHRHPDYERASHFELPIQNYVWRFEPEEALIALRGTALSQLGYRADSVTSPNLVDAIRAALRNVAKPVVSVFGAELFFTTTGRALAHAFRSAEPIAGVTWVLHVNVPPALMSGLDLPFDLGRRRISLNDLTPESGWELAQAIAPWWTLDDVRFVMAHATGGSRGLFFDLARCSRGSSIDRLVESAGSQTGPLESYFVELLKAFADRPRGLSLLRALRDRGTLKLGREELLMLSSWNLARPTISEFKSGEASLERAIPAVRKWLLSSDL